MNKNDPIKQSRVVYKPSKNCTSLTIRAINETVRHIKNIPKPCTAAIYIRYSTPEQGLRSEQRQQELAKEYAGKIGANLHAIYVDRGITGTVFEGRAGLEDLISDAADRLFDTVIVEFMDRLGRRMAGLQAIYRTLSEFGIEIHEVNGSRIDRLTLAFRGLQAVEDRERFLQRTYNGRRKAVTRGLSPHRVRYGFVKTDRKGERIVHEERAVFVRLTYTRFLNDWGPAEIAASLTGEAATPADCVQIDLHGADSRLRSPWTSEMVISILRAPIYKGDIIDGVTSPIRNKGGKVTGYAANPEDQFVKGRLSPEMVIIEEGIWNAAYSRLEERYTTGTKSESKSKFFLTGRLYCGKCRTLMVSYAQHGIRRYRCADTNHPRCVGVGRPSVGGIEAAVMMALIDHLSERGMSASYGDRVHEHMISLQDARDGRIGRQQRLLSALNADISALPALGERMGFSKSTVQARMDEILKSRHQVLEDIDVESRRVIYDESHYEKIDILQLKRKLAEQTPIRAHTEVDWRLLSTLRSAIKRVEIDSDGKALHVTLNSGVKLVAAPLGK